MNHCDCKNQLNQRIYKLHHSVHGIFYYACCLKDAINKDKIYTNKKPSKSL